MRSRVRRTGVAFPYTPFQVSDALWMMFRFPWEVLRCIVVGTVGTLLLGLLFQMLHRAGLSQSHRRSTSGVFGLFGGECLLRGSTGCSFQFTKAGGAGVLAPLTGTTTCRQALTDTSVFPMTLQVKREATRMLSKTWSPRILTPLLCLGSLAVGAAPGLSVLAGSSAASGPDALDSEP